jgi:predicted ABC-type ATPase
MRGPYRWNPGTGRYHGAGGLIVSQQEIRRALDEALDRLQKRVAANAEALRSGKITLKAWRDQMQADLKDTHLYSAAAAKGGWAQLTARDYGMVGQQLREQYKYLDRLARQIRSGVQALDGSFMVRSKLYAQSGRATYHLIEADLMDRLGMNEERNRLNPAAEHCDGCIAESARGWVKRGALTPIGSRTCLSNDRCEINYRKNAGVRVGNPMRWSADDFPPADDEAPDSLQRFQLSDGSLTPERQKLHDAIVSKYMRGIKGVEHPVVNLLGGGPASGKSMLVDLVRKEQADTGAATGVHIDVDEIRTLLPEYYDRMARGDFRAAKYTHEEASLIGKRIRKVASARHANFTADGTGNSGITELESKVKLYRESGATIRARYVTVNTETAMVRMIDRAKKTGRFVPKSFLRDVHRDVAEVFPEAIKRGLFDEFELWDTNLKDARLVVSGNRTHLIIHNRDLWDRFLAKQKENTRPPGETDD